jgi:hypothetical protein
MRKLAGVASAYFSPVLSCTFRGIFGSAPLQQRRLFCFCENGPGTRHRAGGQQCHHICLDRSRRAIKLKAVD